MKVDFLVIKLQLSIFLITKIIQKTIYHCDNTIKINISNGSVTEVHLLFSFFVLKNVF